MKSKAPLALMEQLVMILVFALAAALCLQIFVLSGNLSVTSETRDRAVTAVQNTAETLKLCRGDLEEVQKLLGGEKTEDCWQMILTGKETLCVTAERIADEAEALGEARVYAVNDKGSVVFEVNVCWQEEWDG
ncbi:MAG: hypothetical protein E7335_04470 [Clostridiales bacterium]|nr:hypothetical protein [Clostridiales bacterium]